MTTELEQEHDCGRGVSSECPNGDCMHGLYAYGNLQLYSNTGLDVGELNTDERTTDRKATKPCVSIDGARYARFIYWWRTAASL